MAKNKWNMFGESAAAKAPTEKKAGDHGKWGVLMEEHNTKTEE